MFVVSALMPPSHFASSAKFAGPNRIPSTIGTTQSLRRVNQGVTSRDPASSKPWLALSQPQQEIMKGRRENQRITMLDHDSVRGSSPVDAVSDLLRSRYVTVFCLAYREQLVALSTMQVLPLSWKQMEWGTWTVVLWVWVRVVYRSREVQDRNWKAEDAGGSPEEHGTGTQGRD